MPEKPLNVGASVRQRLLNLAHARGQPLELLLCCCAAVLLCCCAAVLLEMPSPHLRAYPQETVIAEKLHAFAADLRKQAQWDAFSRNLSAPGPTLAEVITDLQNSLLPLFKPE
jgi:hypothetical protein